MNHNPISINPSPLKSIRDIAVGDNYTLSISVTEELVIKFAEFTGDYNPLHMDEAFAKSTPFRGRVAHGMALGSFLSTIIGMYLPGPGALWLSQNYDFVAPVRIGDTVHIHATIVRKSEAQGIIFLEVEAKTQKGLVVLRSEGKVKIIEEVKQMESKEIKDCRVLVTGASRGLGAKIALKFVENGAHVFINYRNSEKDALEVKKESETLSGTVKLVHGDITTEAGINEMLEQIDDKLVDIVVLNAVDDLRQAMFLEQKLADFERALDYGVRSPFRLLQALLPSMIKQEFGRIVSISSAYTSGSPPAGFSSYVVNKRSLESITKSIAVEYGKHNVCANMISPNMLRTDLTADTPERAKQLLEAQTPLRRLASLDEIANSVLYLCSPLGSYVNGHNLILSGGSTIL